MFQKIFSGCRADGVCSARHGLDNILYSCCIRVNPAGWSEETDCRCIQPSHIERMRSCRGWKERRLFDAHHVAWFNFTAQCLAQPLNFSRFCYTLPLNSMRPTWIWCDRSTHRGALFWRFARSYLLNNSSASHIWRSAEILKNISVWASTRPLNRFPLIFSCIYLQSNPLWTRSHTGFTSSKS